MFMVNKKWYILVKILYLVIKYLNNINAYFHELWKIMECSKSNYK